MNEVPITIEQMASILGGTPPVADTPPASASETPSASEANPTPAPTNNNPPAQETPPATSSETPPTETPPASAATTAQPLADTDALQQLNQHRAQEAFAAMRVQNKQLNDTLKGVASLLGIDGNVDQKTLMDTLQAKILENQAKQQNVPVELLQRLQMLEQQNMQFTAQQRQQNIEKGFAQVKETYKLDQAQLNKFAEDLIANGMNPFTQDIDLNKAYRDLHFDEIVAAKVQEAVLAEQARAAAASNNGSNPGNQQGNYQQGDNLTKVNSVRDLETYFNQMLNK